MSPRILSKIGSMLILGVLLATLLHQDLAPYYKMSKEDFLTKQAERFDRDFKEVQSFGVEIIACIMFGGMVFGVYELLAAGIYHLLRLRYHRVTGEQKVTDISSS